MNLKVGAKMLSEFEILKKELKELLNSNDNRKSLYKWLKSELAYTSNAIEGNTNYRLALLCQQNLLSD